MKLILKLALNTAALLGIGYFMPAVMVPDILTGLLTAIVFGLVNTFIKPIIKLLTLPISVITLGLFSIVINAFLAWIVTLIVPGFEIMGFWNYFLFAIVLSIVSTILNWIF